MKSKGLLALVLVVGLVLMAGNVRAATSLDNVPGFIVAGIWEGTDSGIGTIFMLKNTNATYYYKVHYVIYGECSKHVADSDIVLSPKDSTGLHIYFENGTMKVLTGKYDPNEGKPQSCKGNYSADADGYYRGYGLFYIEDKCKDGSDWAKYSPDPSDNALALSISILNPDTWYTGINGVAVQLEGGDTVPTTADAARAYLDATLKESPWDGRWYASSIWNGQLLVCFPGNKSKACKYTIAGDNWDEDENPSSFELTVPEVARIPITGNFSTEVEQWIAAYGDAETGWVQITEATNGTADVGMFGLIILEEPDINAADVLPLWHQED